MKLLKIQRNRTLKLPNGLILLSYNVFGNVHDFTVIIFRDLANTTIFASADLVAFGKLDAAI